MRTPFLDIGWQPSLLCLKRYLFDSKKALTTPRLVSSFKGLIPVSDHHRTFFCFMIIPEPFNFNFPIIPKLLYSNFPKLFNSPFPIIPQLFNSNFRLSPNLLIPIFRFSPSFLISIFRLSPHVFNSNFPIIPRLSPNFEYGSGPGSLLLFLLHARNRPVMMPT